MRAVCLLPNMQLFYHQDAEYWLNAFSAEAGVTATDVVLPAFVAGGAAYDSKFGRISARLDQFNWLGQWHNSVRTQLPTSRCWGLVVPTLEMLVNPTLAVRDQWDQQMDEICILQPMLQPILAQIATELKAIGLDGMVLDLTNLYPNSTSSLYSTAAAQNERRQNLQNTCFCRVCRPAVERAMHWDDATVWFRSPEHNITRLVLQPHGRGASHIDLPQLWMDQTDADSLAQLATARQFVSPDDPHLLRDAASLIGYAKVRTQLVAAAVAAIGTAARNIGLRTAALLPSMEFDITTQTTPASLRQIDALDEYWVAGYEADSADQGQQVITLLDRRAIYYHNALVEQLTRLERYSGAADEEQIARVLQSWHIVERPAGSTRGQVEVLNMLGTCAGFGLVPLQREQFISHLRRESDVGRLSERLRTTFLLQLGDRDTDSGSADRRRPRRAGPYGA